jgi:hypothetical protein
VNAIKDNKERLGGKVDYETNLLIMEDFNMDQSTYSTEEDEPKPQPDNVSHVSTGSASKPAKSELRPELSKKPESEKEKDRLLE